jgi:hypothetical protein
MVLNQGMFAIKLFELNHQYDQLQNRLLIFQNGDQNEILQEITKLKDECTENDFLLQSRIKSSRSLAVSKLAAAQMDYNKQTEKILKKTSLGFQDEKIQKKEQTEVAALYAEYAIDFATQAMRHALLASLCALDMQRTDEEIHKVRRLNDE